jgi:ssDNA-binding Zn-finger/Zn-ribbon topoisomerase 1
MKRLIKTHPEPWCPDCGAKMELCYPAVGQPWEPFWRCSRYPDCHGIMESALTAALGPAGIGWMKVCEAGKSEIFIS